MTHEEAIEAAKALAAARKATWFEPVSVTETRSFLWFFGRKRLVVNTNVGSRGCNICVEFDALTGEVLRAAFMPR